MKPQFALSLSSDGISLLTRGTEGWHGLGTVGFGADTMEAELTALRQRGAELAQSPATDPLPVKLIIPEDQIRYLALDTGPLPLGSRRDAAASALEGATPYAVSELSFDIAAHGVTTHVAAVALETLQEAETFARAQGFAPLCFLATPTEAAFVGEAFLGTPPGTPADVTTALKADRLPVRDIGPLPQATPTLPVAPSPIEQATQAPLPLGLDVQVYDDSAPGDDSPAMGFSSRRASSAPQPAADPAPAPVAEQTPSAEAADPITAPETPLAEPAAPAPEASAPETAALNTAAQNAEAASAPAAEPLAPEAKDIPAPLAENPAPKAEKQAPKAPAAVATQVQSPAPQPQALKTQTPKTQTPKTPAPNATKPQGPEAQAPSALPAAPAAPSAPARIPAAPSAPKSAPAPQFTRQGSPLPPPAAPAPDPKSFAAVVAAASSGAVIDPPATDKKRKPAIPAALASVLGTSATPTATSATKPVAQPVPGPEAKTAKLKRPPLNAKHMLLATAALVVVLGGAMAVLPALLQSDDTADSDRVEAEIALDTSPALIAPAETPHVDSALPAGQQDSPADTLAALQDPADPALIASLPAPRLLEPQTAQDTATEGLLPEAVDTADQTAPSVAPVDTPVTPQALSQAAQYAATGIWQVAPEIADLPKFVPLDGIQLPQIDRGAPALTDSDLAHAPATQSYDTDLGLAGIATASAVAVEPAATTEVAAAEATPQGPATDAAEQTAEVTAGDVEIAAADAPEEVLPPEAATQSAEAPTAAEPASAETAEPARDARGLIIATAEGVLAPEGFRVFKGRPDIVPPAVPDRLDAEDLAAQRAAQEAAELRRELGRIRPRLRPASLTRTADAAEETPQEATADAAADAALTDIAAAAEAALAQATGVDTDTGADTGTDTGAAETAEVAETPVDPIPRPRMRPRTLTAIGRAVAEANAAPEAEADAEAVATPAVASATLRPRSRPTNFETLLQRAREQATARNTRAASVAPAIPSSASVARQATQNDVLNLRRLNLIGVYGTSSNRRALVRLASGRYVKVKVGDKIDGGRIVAIGQDQLRYQKGSRSTTLRMPSS